MRYFKYSEFDSPDQPGSGRHMNTDTLTKLDFARELAGIPFLITSGYRTEEHNHRVGGVRNSAHTKGKAADIRCETGGQRFKMVRALLDAGFNRIGIGETFIHADDDGSLPQNVMWDYYD